MYIIRLLKGFRSRALSGFSLTIMLGAVGEININMEMFKVCDTRVLYFYYCDTNMATVLSMWRKP